MNLNVIGTIYVSPKECGGTPEARLIADDPVSCDKNFAKRLVEHGWTVHKTHANLDDLEAMHKQGYFVLWSD